MSVLDLCQICLCHERGNTQYSTHLSTETGPSPLLAIFLDPSFSFAGVRNSLSEFCVLHHFKFSANRWPEISWFSNTTRVSWQGGVALAKQMLGESSQNVNIGHPEYEMVPPRFQRLCLISAGINAVSNYNRKTWYNLSCLLQACCHLSTKTKLSVIWQNWRDLWHNQQWQW